MLSGGIATLVADDEFESTMGGLFFVVACRDVIALKNIGSITIVARSEIDLRKMVSISSLFLLGNIAPLVMDVCGNRFQLLVLLIF